MDQKQLDDVELKEEPKEEFSSEDSDILDEDPLDMPENEEQEDISETPEVEPLNESEIPEAATDVASSDEQSEESDTTSADSYAHSESETETFSQEESASSEEKTNDVNDIIENNHKDEEKPEESKPESNQEPENDPKPQTEDTWKTDNEDNVPKSSNWKYISGVLLILLVVAIYTNGFNFTGATTVSTSSMTVIDAEDKVLDYVNNNLLQPPFTATVVSSEELDNLFQVTLDVAGQEVNSYVTKDGRFFFPQGFDLDASLELETPETELIEVSVDDDPMKGDPDAPVTMIEFSEFQCPFCKRYIDDAYQEIIKEYVDTGKVKYIFRDFPLSFHDQAKPAAMASECAHEQDNYWEFHDLLFENQGSLSLENYKKWAVELGLDTEQFNTCLDTEKYLEEVEKDFTDGQKYGVSGTPAFFINGRLISGAQPFAAFKQVIEEALSNLESSEEIEELEEQIEELAEMVEEEVEEEEEVGETTETQESESAVKEIQMAVKKWRFDPKHIEVNEGDQVKLTISSEELDLNFILSAFRISEKITAGESVTVEFTADKIGTFNFLCGDFCLGKYGQVQGAALRGEIVVN